MKKLKRKLGKLLAVVFCCVIISFSFLLPASALDVEGVNSFGGFALDYITIVAYDSSGNLLDILNTSYVSGTDSFSGRGLTVSVTTHETFMPGNDYTIAIALGMANDRYKDPDSYVSGSYMVGLNKDFWSVYETVDTAGLTSYACRSNRTLNTSADSGYSVNYSQYANVTFPSTSYTHYMKATYGYNELGDYYNLYMTKLKATPTKQFNKFSIALYDFDFSVLTEQEALNNELKDNIDNNTDKIIENQDKIFDEILNGWTDPNEIDASVTDEYSKEQDKIIDSTAEGREEMLSVYNNFGNLFNKDGSLYKGLHVVTNTFTAFFMIDWVSSLVNFSLSLGVFSFLIGAVNIVVGKIGASRAEKNKPPREYIYHHYHHSVKRNRNKNKKE